MPPESRAAPSSSDRWAYLGRPSERLRYAAIGSLIRSHGLRGRIVEIGAGRGELLGWLDPAHVETYVAVDIDAHLLGELGHDRIAIERVNRALEIYTPERQPIAALVLSEVLYYTEVSSHHLMRIWRSACRIDLALVSTVLPRPDKPNWQRSYDRVRQALADTAWPVLDTIRIDSAAEQLAWEVTVLAPGPAG